MDAVLVLIFAFGLSMDYCVFLLSLIKEVHGQTEVNDTGVAVGLQRSGGIITSGAALIVVVFTGFALGDVLAFKQLGVGLVIDSDLRIGLVIDSDPRAPAAAGGRDDRARRLELVGTRAAAPLAQPLRPARSTVDHRHLSAAATDSVPIDLRIPTGGAALATDPQR